MIIWFVNLSMNLIEQCIYIYFIFIVDIGVWRWTAGKHGFVREAWINWHITRWCWRVKYCCFFTYSAISVNLNLVVYYGFRARLKKILEQSKVCRPHDKGLLTIKKKKKKNWWFQHWQHNAEKYGWQSPRCGDQSLPATRWSTLSSK